MLLAAVFLQAARQGGLKQAPAIACDAAGLEVLDFRAIISPHCGLGIG